MTNAQAKSELMQIYMSLSEEKKKALDMAFKAMEQADGEYISRQAVIDNKTELKQALYEIRETIDDWWDKRIITNHTVYKMLRKLVEEKMYRD